MSTEAPPTALACLLAAGVPAAAMLLGSGAVFAVRAINPLVQAVFQNLSAGILIAAVAGELFPLLGAAGAEGWRGSAAIALGAGLGLLFFFGLKALLDGDEAEDGRARVAPTGAGAGGGLGAGLASGATSEVERQRLAGVSAAMGRSMAALERHLEVAPPAVVVPEPAELHANPLLDSGGVGALVRGASAEDIRDAFDKELHHMMWLADVAARSAKGAEPLNAHHRSRLAHHLGELRANVGAVAAAVAALPAGGEAAAALGAVTRAVTSLAGTAQHLHENHVERVTAFRRWRPALPIRLSESSDEEGGEEAAPPSAVPWALVAGVTVDGAVDGMLIGLAYVASREAGLIMALATCVEMAFLGLSYSATLGK